MMDALDGNAIAGLLQEVFGAEMTTATVTCGHCSAHWIVGELTVYLQAPGTVVRCRGCADVLMVIVEARGIKCVDLMGMAMLEPRP
jgi:Family of unknown function (DUF6510)